MKSSKRDSDLFITGEYAEVGTKALVFGPTATPLRGQIVKIDIGPQLFDTRNLVKWRRKFFPDARKLMLTGVIVESGDTWPVESEFLLPLWTN